MPNRSFLLDQAHAPQENWVTRLATGKGPTVLATWIVDLKLTSRPTRVAFGGPVELAGRRHG